MDSLDDDDNLGCLSFIPIKGKASSIPRRLAKNMALVKVSGAKDEIKVPFGCEDVSLMCNYSLLELQPIKINIHKMDINLNTSGLEEKLGPERLEFMKHVQGKSLLGLVKLTNYLDFPELLVVSFLCLVKLVRHFGLMALRRNMISPFSSCYKHCGGSKVTMRGVKSFEKLLPPELSYLAIKYCWNGEMAGATKVDMRLLDGCDDKAKVRFLFSKVFLTSEGAARVLKQVKLDEQDVRTLLPKVLTHGTCEMIEHLLVLENGYLKCSSYDMAVKFDPTHIRLSNCGYEKILYSKHRPVAETLKIWNRFPSMNAHHIALSDECGDELALEMLKYCLKGWKNKLSFRAKEFFAHYSEFHWKSIWKWCNFMSVIEFVKEEIFMNQQRCQTLLDGLTGLSRTPHSDELVTFLKAVCLAHKGYVEELDKFGTPCPPMIARIRLALGCDMDTMIDRSMFSRLIFQPSANLPQRVYVAQDVGWMAEQCLIRDWNQLVPLLPVFCGLVGSIKVGHQFACLIIPEMHKMCGDYLDVNWGEVVRLRAHEMDPGFLKMILAKFNLTLKRDVCCKPGELFNVALNLGMHQNDLFVFFLNTIRDEYLGCDMDQFERFVDMLDMNGLVRLNLTRFSHWQRTEMLNLIQARLGNKKRKREQEDEVFCKRHMACSSF